jgi:signal transduction histidine kinase
MRSLLHITEWPELSAGDYWLTIGVTTNSAHVFRASMIPETDLISNIGRHTFIKGVYLGILIVAFGFYLTFAILSADRSVNWYAAYIFSLFLVNLGVSGYAQFLFSGLWPLASDFITGAGTAFAVATSITMWTYIIRLDQYNRGLFYVMIGFSLLAGLGFLTATSNAYITFAKLFFVPDVILLVVLLGYLIYVGYRENKLLQLSFLMVALGIPTLAVIVHLLLLIGLVPVNSFTTNIYSGSSFIHLTMVAMAMGYRTYKLTHQRVSALASSQRAQQLAGEQRAFITMLSHEFRTPLAIIQRSAEILGLHLNDEQKAVHNRLGTIRTNASQLSGLVDAFLTKETLDSATFTTSREPVAIDKFLEDLINRRHREVPGQNINLINSEFAIVDVDRILLERAIVNLIENARKYAPGAAVWIACNRSANGYVYIRVVDEGPGISPEDLQNVLNAFYRGREASTTQGVGLGLHLTNRILQAHNGSLSVSVGEKGGTTVLIKLPYNQDATVLKTNDVFAQITGNVKRPTNKRGKK